MHALVVAVCCMDKYWCCCSHVGHPYHCLLALVLAPCRMVTLLPSLSLCPGCWRDLPPLSAFPWSAPYILPHWTLPSFLYFQLLMMFRLSALWVEEQRGENRGWKAKVTDHHKVLQSHIENEGKGEEYAGCKDAGRSWPNRVPFGGSQLLCV